MRTRLRNGEHGYGLVTKLLHWLTICLLAAQFVLGYSMEADAAADRADDRADALEERAEERGEAAEELAEAQVERLEREADTLDDSAGADELADVLTGSALEGGVSAVEAHVALGLTLVVLALVRLLWRRTTPLPPWAEHLSGAERRVEATLEKAMLALLLVVPATGLLLVAYGGSLLPLHVAAQVALLATVAGHVALVLRHTAVHRHRQLARML